MAQDTGFSVQSQGFDSPRGYFAKLHHFAGGRSFSHEGPFLTGRRRVLRSCASRCGWLLRRIMCRFFARMQIYCAGFCAALVGRAGDRIGVVVIGHLQVVLVSDWRKDRNPVAELELMVIELATSLRGPMRDQGTN